jgi:hypothetical protein
MVQRRRKLKVRHFVSGLKGWVSAIAFILWIAARTADEPNKSLTARVADLKRHCHELRRMTSLSCTSAGTFFQPTSKA